MDFGTFKIGMVQLLALGQLLKAPATWVAKAVVGLVILASV